MPIAVSSGEDSSETSIHVAEHHKSWLTKLEFQRYRDFERMLADGVLDGLTILDTFDLWQLDKTQADTNERRKSDKTIHPGMNIENLLRTIYHRRFSEDTAYMPYVSNKLPPLKERDFLSRFNQVYTRAIKYMEEFEQLAVPDEFKYRTFEKANDCIDFLYLSTQNAPKEHREGYSSVIRCIVLKTMLVVHDILDNPVLSDLDAKLGYVFDEIGSIGGFKKIATTEDRTDFLYTRAWADQITPKAVLIGRPKKEDSIISKELRDRKYTSTNMLTDAVAVTLELSDFENDEQKIQFCLSLVQKCFPNGCEFEQKESSNVNSTNSDLFRVLSPSAESSMIKRWNGIRHRWRKKKGAVGEEYFDAKFVGRMPYKGWWIPLEIKLVMVNNKNESGFQHHDILKTKRSLTERCRKNKWCCLSDVRELIGQYGIKSQIHENKIFEYLVSGRIRKKGEILFYSDENKEPPFLIPIDIGDGTIAFLTRDYYTDALEKTFRDYPKVIEAPKRQDDGSDATEESKKLYENVIAAVYSEYMKMVEID